MNVSVPLDNVVWSVTQGCVVIEVVVHDIHGKCRHQVACQRSFRHSNRSTLVWLDG